MYGHDVAGVVIAKVEAGYVCGGDWVGWSSVLCGPTLCVLDVVYGVEVESGGKDGLCSWQYILDSTFH